MKKIYLHLYLHSSHLHTQFNLYSLNILQTLLVYFGTIIQEVLYFNPKHVILFNHFYYFEEIYKNLYFNV